MAEPYYQDDAVTIYHGDCQEILPELRVDAAFFNDRPVDALVTDPPYGVGFAGKVTKDTNLRGIDTYEDTEENFWKVVLPAVSTALGLAERGVVFSGVRRLQEYPRARDIGGIICPAGGGISPWGFGCFHPALFYGSSPHIGARPTATVINHPGMHITGERNGHPCPKPIAFMKWAVERASLGGETVLDPFMGSGTTLRAAKDLGRKGIGIEIDERYCEIAAQRMGQEVLDLEGV